MQASIRPVFIKLLALVILAVSIPLPLIVLLVLTQRHILKGFSSILIVYFDIYMAVGFLISFLGTTMWFKEKVEVVLRGGPMTPRQVLQLSLDTVLRLLGILFWLYVLLILNPGYLITCEILKLCD